jgi:riboflavin transporter FmnP
MMRLIPVLVECFALGVTVALVIAVTRVILTSIKRNTATRANFACRLFSFSIETTRPVPALSKNDQN